MIIKLTLETGFVGAQHVEYIEIDKTVEEWDAMSYEEQEDYLEQDIDSLISENIYVSFQEEV